MGTQKSHWGSPGGHLSSQERLLEGTFYGPTFYMKFGSQNYHKKLFFLDRSTWLKHNKYCVELTFSCFFWGPGFSSVLDPCLGLLLAPFLTSLGPRCPPRGPRGAQEELPEGAYFWGSFLDHLATRGGDLSLKLTLTPPSHL